MQAAGRASLSDSDDVADPAGRHTRLFLAVALVGLAVDQITKSLVVAHWTHDVALIGSLLTLHLTYNPGAAFSTGTSLTFLISCIAILATVVVIRLGWQVRDWVWALALGLLLAGITGNLADRLFREPSPMRGHVVDFLQLPNWPVFNVADMMINVAAALIIVQSFRGVRMNGQRATSQSTAEPTDE